MTARIKELEARVAELERQLNQALIDGREGNTKADEERRKLQEELAARDRVITQKENELSDFDRKYQRERDGWANAKHLLEDEISRL